MSNIQEIETLVRELRSPETYRQARAQLVLIGEPAIIALINALGDEQNSFSAAEVLSEIGAPAVRPLITALGSENEKIASYAAIALEDIGLPAVESLITALASKNQRKLIFVVRALGCIGDKSAIEPLSNLLDKPARFNRDGILLAVTIESLKNLGEVIEKSQVAALEAAVKTRRSSKSQTLLQKFIEQLREKGFKLSSRSDHIYYHEQIPDVRWVLRQRVIRLERRNGKWKLGSSFSISRETQQAIQVLGDISKSATLGESD